MTEEQLDKLFQAYYKVDTSESRKLNPNGNGLGLSICKNMANCLGGDLIVTSEWGIGSCFSFSFEPAIVDVN